MLKCYSKNKVTLTESSAKETLQSSVKENNQLVSYKE